MKRMFRSIAARPLVTTALAVVAVALILLAVPISYERTIGYEARLKIHAPGLDGAHVASEFAKFLRTGACNYNRSGDDVEISARVPRGSRKAIQGLAMAYAQSLAMRGIPASASVRPITERTSGSVYAAALYELITIRVDREGKTTEQIASEIRDRLAESGMPGADVQVTEQGDQLRMEMRWEAAPGDSLPQGKEIHVTME